MTMNNKYLLFLMIAILSLFMFSASVSTAAEELTGEAHSALPSDKVITGMMDDYSKYMIVVDGVRYIYCKEVEFFTSNNILIDSNDLDTAQQVKVFENGNCARQVTVMEFAH